MSTKKPVAYLVFALALVVVLLFTFGCSTSTPAPATSAPVTSPAAAQGDKVIELKANIAWNSTSSQNGHFERLKERLETASNGRLTLRIYPGSTLVPEKEMWDGVVTGLADIVGGSRYETRGCDFMNNILIFAIGAKTGKIGSYVARDLYNEIPEFKKEWENAKLLYFAGTGPNHIITASKPVRTLNDLKGLQIRSGPAGGMPDLLKSLGASPVSLPAGEVYTALQKKTIEGASFPAEAMKTFRIGEVIKYINDVDLWAMPANFVAMNQASYDKLPADLQKVIDDNLEWAWNDLNDVFTQGDDVGYEFARGYGLEVVEVTDKDAWYAALQPLQEKTAKDLDAKGLPGTRFWQLIQQRIEYWNSQNVQ